MLYGQPILDLNYREDSQADVDLNIVMTSDERFVEIQGTAEKKPFTESDLSRMLTLAKKSLREILVLQTQAIETL